MRKQLHYVTLLLLFITSNIFANESYVDLYINTYKDIAIREMMRSGIPASITLAQGIHESSWGKGELALKSNNHFGIKCKDYWRGNSYYYKDDDFDKNGNLIKSCFRAYKNPESSYIDHTDFLMTTAHYQELFNYDNTDYRRWAKGLKKCGYATDKQYAEKLIRTIEKYQLYKYDIPTAKPMLAAAPKYNISKLLIRNEEEVEPQSVAPQFVAMELNVPKAIAIPADYQRKPKEKKTVIFEKYEMPKVEQKRKMTFENEKPEERIVQGVSEKRERIKVHLNEPPKAVEIAEERLEVEKGSIIPAAFASTKKSYLLSRKPRSSNSILR